MVRDELGEWSRVRLKLRERRCVQLGDPVRLADLLAERHRLWVLDYLDLVLAELDAQLHIEPV